LIGEDEGDRLCFVLGKALKADGSKPALVDGKVRSKAWRDAGRMLIAEDGVDPVEAEAVLLWTQHDAKWREKITTINGFRGMYDGARRAALGDKRNPVRFDVRPAPPPVLETVSAADWDQIREWFARDIASDVNEIWLSQLTPAGLNGRVLWLSGSARATSWIELRYARVLARAAEKVLEIEDLAIEFTAGTPSQPTTDEQQLEEKTSNVA
jgi:hypothetical protein